MSSGRFLESCFWMFSLEVRISCFTLLETVWMASWFFMKGAETPRNIITGIGSSICSSFCEVGFFLGSGLVGFFSFLR